MTCAARATSEKTHAVAVAQAEKQYHLDLLEHVHESGSYGTYYDGYYYGYSNC